jgi:Uma2 family endonuclease
MITGSDPEDARRIAVDILTETPPISPPLPDLYEVVNGEIKELHGGARQVQIAFYLAHLLESFARPKKLGQAVTEMLFHLRDDAPERRPDAAFISASRWPLRRRAPSTNAWNVVPDLAVEVVSPTNTFDEIRGKTLEYFQAGVLMVWVVPTIHEEVHVYLSPTEPRILTRADILRGEPVLPSFELPLHELFVGQDTDPDSGGAQSGSES